LFKAALGSGASRRVCCGGGGGGGDAEFEVAALLALPPPLPLAIAAASLAAINLNLVRVLAFPHFRPPARGVRRSRNDVCLALPVATYIIMMLPSYGNTGAREGSVCGGKSC
jgi:hypothetical protein